MDNNWIVLLQQQTYLTEIMETNQKTARFGLVLSRQDSEIILKERNPCLAATEKSRIWPGDYHKNYL